MTEDFEAWEGHYELYERADYPALVELCEREVASRPEDLYALERLGQAYVLNGQHQEALDLMGRCHAADPDLECFSHILLDALFAMGKNEHDYPWKKRPRILRIGPEVSDLCFEYLRPKRKPRSIDELYLELSLAAYLTFTAADLLAFLRREARFVVEDDARGWSSLLKIDRSIGARKGHR